MSATFCQILNIADSFFQVSAEAFWTLQNLENSSDSRYASAQTSLLSEFAPALKNKTRRLWPWSSSARVCECRIVTARLIALRQRSPGPVWQVECCLYACDRSTCRAVAANRTLPPTARWSPERQVSVPRGLTSFLAAQHSASTVRDNAHQSSDELMPLKSSLVCLVFVSGTLCRWNDSKTPVSKATIVRVSETFRTD